MTTINFCCVWVGEKYSIDYVNRLFASILRHYNGLCTFTVFTDHWDQFADVCRGVRVIATPRDVKGYWNKLFLFARSGHGHWLAGERVVYFDLDVLIVGDLSWLAELSPLPLWMARDSIRSERANSSVMAWRSASNPTGEIWSEWQEQGRPLGRALPHSKGDQAWIERVLASGGNGPYFLPPERVVFYYRPRPNSKKWDTLEKIPPGASVVVFHGKPHFDELQHTIPWVKEHWRS